MRDPPKRKNSIGVFLYLEFWIELPQQFEYLSSLDRLRETGFIQFGQLDGIPVSGLECVYGECASVVRKREGM